MGDERKRTGRSSSEERLPRDPRRGAEQDDDPCRCKQVAVMTPKQLLGTMLKDLAFWKKEKK
jgi:hypothetical protein